MISKRQAQRIRTEMEKYAITLDDAQALEVPEFFPLWTPKAYKTDDRVRYNQILYKCIQDHSKNETYTPDTAVSLWTQVLIPNSETIPEWIQPESTNPYMKGDKVTHNNSTWQSDIDYNVFEPGVAGWSIVE